ncbi:TMV resistance protein N-like [Neltuma alba]|uniref:TMV resistance protein N-like n=1 Tax=Neltuma alba TaxID=207710 RepID=UPI0010A4C99B|nr:TMV resistance protein N-like [Prosopis alba]
MTRRPKISSIHYEWTYDVFLNFRGEDTRHSFIGTLNKELNRKGVHTFFDDKEIGIGDEITPTLLKAIRESRMAITVFSKEYASSTFCLNELVQIHQCIKKNGRLVWPIFYDVEPSEVRHQRGKYGQALATHRQNSRADEEKMKSWKHALHEIADLKGSSCDPRKDYEHVLIEDTVDHLFRIIRRAPLDVAEYPVGLNSRLQKINSLLQLGSNDEVIMMGIYGTGGMGKTTITRAVYNTIADNFDYLCFLDDIKGGSGKHGLEQEQARMLSKLLGEKIEIEEISQGVKLIKRMLKDKKVLLILDNVDERMQLRKLAGACEWFGWGSRIIITTRDLHLLKSHGVERIYEMEGLNHEESLELLSWNAFGKMQVDAPRYTEVVNEVISYSSGLPLALEILSRDLYGKNVNEWKSMLDGCKRIPHGKIQQILEVSYEGLQQLEKEVFLDIACFDKGSELEYVKKMVAIAHDFDPDYHIGVLVDKCLIKIYGGCLIQMHDLVQDMGRDIVRLQSPKDPGKRSRLWSNKDILRVLERNEKDNT